MRKVSRWESEQVGTTQTKVNINLTFSLSHLLTSKGFTLIEILIAVAISALILTIIYGSYAASINTMNACRESADINQMARLALDRISEDISCALTSSTNENLQFVGKDSEELEGTPMDTLDFTSTNCLALFRGARECGICEIGYCIKQAPSEALWGRGTSTPLTGQESDSDRFVLLRREQSPPDKEPFSGGEFLGLAEEIKELDFEYYDGKKWLSQWGPNEREALPSAVKISLTFQDKEGMPSTFSTIAFIPCHQ